MSGQDERKAEIDSSGLFQLVEKIEYIQEITNSPQQYLMAMKSVPTFASLLDGMEEKMIEKMDREIEEVFHNYGGFSRGLFQFSLYIARKI